ncbi:MAG: creatininase family protein [Acidobacteriia bacterium]|nr:creatininase family protein [Terriglobia bacterium]
MGKFEKLTSETVRAAGGKGILILPVGSVEQHGPHLPLTVDMEIPARIAALLAERTGGFVAPGISYGARSLPQSGGSPDLAGTVHVRGSVLTEYVKDVIGGYLASGFRSIVVLNGHYENESFLFEALELCREEGKLEGAKVIALSWWSLVPDALLDQLFGGKFPGWHAEHASACETSLLLHLKKDLVGEARVDNPAPPRAGIYFFPVEPSKVSNRGVLGTTSTSSSEIGAALYGEICSQLEALVREHMGGAAR